VLVVGPFVLVSGLLPLLQRTRCQGRLRDVGGMYTQKLDLDDLQSTLAPFSGRAPTLARSGPRSPSSGSGRAACADRRHDQRDASWLGRHAGLAETLPGFYRAMRPCCEARGGVDTIAWLAADPAGARRAGRCTWTDGRDPSTGSRDAAERGDPAPLGHDRGAVRCARPCPEA